VHNINSFINTSNGLLVVIPISLTSVGKGNRDGGSGSTLFGEGSPEILVRINPRNGVDGSTQLSSDSTKYYVLSCS
jgi:hypothetical protein